MILTSYLCHRVQILILELNHTVSMTPLVVIIGLDEKYTDISHA